MQLDVASPSAVTASTTGIAVVQSVIELTAASAVSLVRPTRLRVSSNGNARTRLCPRSIPPARQRGADRRLTHMLLMAQNSAAACTIDCSSSDTASGTSHTQLATDGVPTAGQMVTLVNVVRPRPLSAGAAARKTHRIPARSAGHKCDHILRRRQHCRLYWRQRDDLCRNKARAGGTETGAGLPRYSQLHLPRQRGQWELAALK